LAGDEALALDYSHDESRDVIFPVGIEAGHLCSLAANERTGILATGISKTGDDSLSHLRIKFSGCEVVEKEQRCRALYSNIVHAMIHEIRPDCLVQVHRKSDLQFCAYTIGTRDQYGITILCAQSE